MMLAGSKCDLCGRTALPRGTYCRVHKTAFDEVQKGFERWESAFVNMSWERYLESISELRETGEASRQIAEHLLKQMKRL